MVLQVSLVMATPSDVNFIADIKTNADLWYFEDHVPTDKDAVRKTVAERVESDWYRQYLICQNDDRHTPVGELHIHWYTKERESWEIGYAIFPEYRGRGFCAAAARQALQLAFEDWGAHKVVAMCNAHNVASYRVMERIGMRKEGVFREELPWNDQWVDQYFYAILDHEYRSQLSNS